MRWMKFEGPTFNLDVPGTWLVKATPQFQAMFVGKKGDDELIFPSLTVAIILTEDDLMTYFSQIAELQNIDYPGYQITDEAQSETWLERTYLWQYPGTTERLIQRQRFYMDKGNIYTLTATHLPSQADPVQGIFDAMMNSFEFI